MGTESMHVSPHGTFTYTPEAYARAMARSKADLLAAVRRVHEPDGVKVDGRMAKAKLAAMVAEWDTGREWAEAEIEARDQARREAVVRLAMSDPRQGWTYYGRSSSDPTLAHRCENCAARAPRDTKCDLCGWGKREKRRESSRRDSGLGGGR